MKEPLRTVKNFSQLLQKNFKTLPEEKISEYLKYINESTTSMYMLLESLLSFSTASRAVEKKIIDLNEVINNLLNDLRGTIDSRIVKIEKLPKVYADSAAMRQVFQNFITNSIKFKAKHRDLLINISAQTTIDEHIICIEDNAIGIKEEYHEIIFMLLKRLHTKSEVEGSGVGLSICKKLIELHSGRIWVESQEGVGSKFFFSLPRP